MFKANDELANDIVCLIFAQTLVVIVVVPLVPVTPREGGSRRNGKEAGSDREESHPGRMNVSGCRALKSTLEMGSSAVMNVSRAGIRRYELAGLEDLLYILIDKDEIELTAYPCQSARYESLRASPGRLDGTGVKDKSASIR